MYRIDLKDTSNTPVPCTVIPSINAIGKMVCVNEDGSSLVVLPDGSQRSTSEPSTSPNFDSPWTQADLISGVLFYRSFQGSNPGIPRAYRVYR